MNEREHNSHPVCVQLSTQLLISKSIMSLLLLLLLLIPQTSFAEQSPVTLQRRAILAQCQACDSIDGDRTAKTYAANSNTGVGSSPDAVQKAVLPLIYDPPAIPYPLVSLSIGEGPPLLFIVDTGTNVAITLQHWAVQALHFDKAPDCVRENISAGGKKVQVFHFKHPPVLKGGNLTVNSDGLRIHGEISDKNTLSEIIRTPRVAGILGMEFWCDNTLQFDFTKKVLTVFVAKPDKESSQSAISRDPLQSSIAGRSPFLGGMTNGISTEVRKYPGFEHIPQVRFLKLENSDSSLSHTTLTSPILGKDYRQQEDNIWLVLDTGSNRTSLPASLLRAHHIPAVGKTKLFQHDRSLNGTQSLLASLTLSGGATARNIMVSSYNESAGVTFVLGMNFLSRFRVTLNGTKNLLYLEPDASNIANIQNSREGVYIDCFSGIEFQADKHNRYFVTNSIPVLTRMGLVVGDEIVEIDGYPLHEYSAFQARMIADSYTGSPACFVVRHKATPESLSVIWLIRPNAFIKSADDPFTKPVSFHLLGPDMCQVIYTDGRIALLPFHCNTNDAPPEPAPNGQEYQRRWTKDFGCIWVLDYIPKPKSNIPSTSAFSAPVTHSTTTTARPA